MISPLWNHTFASLETKNNFTLLWNGEKKINLIRKSSFFIDKLIHSLNMNHIIAQAGGI